MDDAALDIACRWRARHKFSRKALKSSTWESQLAATAKRYLILLGLHKEFSALDRDPNRLCNTWPIWRVPHGSGGG